MEYEFIFVSETHLAEIDDNSLVMLEDYKLMRCNSNSRHTGGVGIYIKNYWNVEILKCESVDLNFWWLSVKVSYRQQVIYLVVFYRAPKYLSVDDLFYENFNRCLNEISEFNGKICICGDMNINWISKDLNKTKISHVIDDCGFKQIVVDHTRITNISRTLIDYVIVNDNYNINAVVNNSLKISDHETIEVFINHNMVVNKREDKVIRHLKYNKERFYSLVNKNDVGTIYYLDSDFKAEHFSLNLRKLVSQFVTEIKVNKRDCLWFSQELKNLKIQKVQQYNKACFMNSTVEWNIYKSIRNGYKNKLINAKNEFIKFKISSSSNQKSMWRNIKSYVLKKEKYEMKDINFDNVIVNGDEKIAKMFNKFFVNSIMQLNSGIPLVPYRNMINVEGRIFNFEMLCKEDLFNIIKNMNSKNDVNFLNVNIIKDSFEVIGENLLSIINKSLECGVFPQIWKESIVVPIEKKCNTNKCQEFRPVNMISNEAKILEKVVSIQLTQYLETNDIIYKYQSGFRNHHSCESLINLVISNWKIEVYNKKFIVAVFLDLSRAFETIDREILLLKLEKYGISGTELKWFQSYLNNRRQRTKINNTISEAIDINIGVPQGSILGVILFVLYINDINCIIKQSKIFLFADDALLYVSGDSMLECINKINNDLNELSLWFKMNKLKLNIDKTKCMCINGVLDDNLVKINNVSIEIVDKIKYLGVIIDNRLNFKDNFDYVCKKIARKVYFLGSIRKNISFKTSIHVFNVVIKPYFEYCPSILFLGNKQMMDRLQKLQNKAMRVILKANKFTHINDMLKKLNWLNVEQLIKYNILVLVFKIKHGLLPKYLSEKLKFVYEVNKYNLRDACNFSLDFYKNDKVKNMLMYKGLLLYNQLPIELKIENSLVKFKQKCKVYCNS